jgi:hypothetical protein
MKAIFKVALFFVILSGYERVVAQEIIITKQGDLFLCDIEEVTEDSVRFSFTFYDHTFHDALPKEKVAYHGRNFIREDLEITGDEYNQDLIVTRNGKVLTCKIVSFIITPTIEYAFLLGDKEMRNVIAKKDVAFLQKSYREQVDLEKKSRDYFHSLALTSGHFRMQPDIQETTVRQDSIDASRDLIFRMNGEDLTCSVEEIDAHTILYAFFMNNKVMENVINKAEVHYIEYDYQGMNPERIVITPKSPDEFQDLIITPDGLTIAAHIEHVGINTVEYYVSKDETTVYQIRKKNELLYYGSNFLDAIKGKEKLALSKYEDFIITRNNSVLQCNIENEYTSSVQYSFRMNKMKMTNIIEKTDIIYFGKNFFILQAEEGSVAQEESSIAEEGSSAGDEKGMVVPSAEKDDTERKPGREEAVRKVDQKPPEVIIISPALSGETTFEAVPDEVSTLMINGVVLDNSPIRKLLVNEKETGMNSQGKFSADIELSSGINTISITASDTENNESHINYFIERMKPAEKAIVMENLDTEPPEFSLYTPALDSGGNLVTVPNTQKSIHISGNVFDQSGVYEVLVNGRDAVLSANGDFSREVLLRIGENKVDIRATDIEANSSTETFVIIRKDAVVKISQPDILGFNDKYYAFIIGVSDYEDPLIPNLGEHPTRDATCLCNVLLEKYLFEKENLNLLLNPSRVEILKSFDRLSRKITENDNLLIFFAGHGYYDRETNLGYWLPSDAESDFTANWIYNDVLVANLKRIHSKHTLLISDACFSGSIFKTRSLNDAPVVYQKKYELRSRKAITSGVLENVPMESVFFRFLVDRLESNQERYMSASELFRNLEFPVANNSPNSPQYGTIQNVDDEGGDFIFIRK